MTVGRVLPQKDPAFFSAVWNLVKSQSEQYEFYWLGGGDSADEERLRQSGITVSGWIGHRELLERLSTADVYIHTAAWEGNPVSILEAASLNVPIIAREIPALKSLGLPHLDTTAEQLAERTLGLRTKAIFDQAIENTSAINRGFTKEIQIRALAELYQVR